MDTDQRDYENSSKSIQFMYQNEYTFDIKDGQTTSLAIPRSLFRYHSLHCADGDFTVEVSNLPGDIIKEDPSNPDNWVTVQASTDTAPANRFQHFYFPCKWMRVKRTSTSGNWKVYLISGASNDANK